MSDFLKVLNERTSAKHFDSATPISVHEIKELISEACQAPPIQYPALALLR